MLCFDWSRNRCGNPQPGSVHFAGGRRVLIYAGTHVSRHHRDRRVLGLPGHGHMQLASHQKRAHHHVRRPWLRHWHLHQHRGNHRRVRTREMRNTRSVVLAVHIEFFYIRQFCGQDNNKVGLVNFIIMVYKLYFSVLTWSNLCFSLSFSFCFSDLYIYYTCKMKLRWQGHKKGAFQ